MTASLVPGETSAEPDGALACVFRLPFDYNGFNGHFPGAPLLPGMCHVDLALHAVRIAVGAPVSLAGIVRARFHRKVRPGENLRVVVRRDGGAMSASWRATHTVSEELAAELVLDVSVIAGTH